MSGDPWYREMAERHRYETDPTRQIEQRAAAAAPFVVYVWRGLRAYYCGVSKEIDPAQHWYVYTDSDDPNDACRKAIEKYGQHNIARFEWAYRDPTDETPAMAADAALPVAPRAKSWERSLTRRDLLRLNAPSMPGDGQIIRDWIERQADKVAATPRPPARPRT